MKLLYTYWLWNILVSQGVVLEGRLHLKFVTDFHLTVLADFDPGVDLLAATDPEHLILHLIGSILDEKLANGQLELQLGDRVVWILEC